MLRDLQVAATARVGEGHDALDPRGGLAREAREQAVDGAGGVALDGKELDAHRAARVVAPADDVGLLEHPDENARVVVVAERLRDERGVRDAAVVAQNAVDAAEELRRRNVPQREASQGGGVRITGEEHCVAR